MLSLGRPAPSPPSTELDSTFCSSTYIVPAGHTKGSQQDPVAVPPGLRSFDSKTRRPSRARLRLSLKESGKSPHPHLKQFETGKAESLKAELDMPRKENLTFFGCWVFFQQRGCAHPSFWKDKEADRQNTWASCWSWNQTSYPVGREAQSSLPALRSCNNQVVWWQQCPTSSVHLQLAFCRPIPVLVPSSEGWRVARGKSLHRIDQFQWQFFFFFSWWASCI